MTLNLKGITTLCIECHYAEPHYAECCYAECCYAECCHAECCYAECRYAECRSAECRSAECRYAERSGTVKRTLLSKQSAAALYTNTGLNIICVEQCCSKYSCKFKLQQK